jgi:LuxR family maltose regulon positive regulatory protein
MLHAYVPLARARQAQGDHSRANALLAQAIDVIERNRLKQNFISLPAFQARLLLYQGQVSAAEAWQRTWTPKEADLRDAVGIAEWYTAIRLLIIQQRPDEARTLLDACLRSAATTGRRTHLIEGYVLAALLAHAAADEPTALAALDQALALADPAGYTRVFLDEGAPMAALLRRASVAGRFPAVCARLLAAFDA